MRKIPAVLLALLLLTAISVYARADHHSFGRRSKAKCTHCTRDSKGRIARSSTARMQFRKKHPCPATGKTKGSCPGYVIDHIVPLKRGGADKPSNMQWQTRAAARAKDRVE